MYQQPKYPYSLLFVSAGVSFDGAISMWVSLSVAKTTGTKIFQISLTYSEKRSLTDLV